MTISDLIQLLLLIATVIGTISSIIISVKTLKQNSKMIEESTKPCILIYKDVININSPIEYLVIKNFGSSGGYINKISYNKSKFENISYDHLKEKQPFKYFEKSFLAPGQNFKVPIKTIDSNVKFITLKIEYSYLNKTYSETFKINLEQEKGMAYLKHHQPSNELKVISSAIQETINRVS